MEEEIKQFDIWVCDLGVDERGLGWGIRPCIVVSNNTNNRHSDRVNVIPLTTSVKAPQVTHCIISSSERTSTAICECIHTVYKAKMGQKSGHLNEMETLNVIYCMKKQFGIN